ncbi:MAG: hypothetical protein WCK65_08610 [Rhodospirillaceae bacterium]
MFSFIPLLSIIVLAYFGIAIGMSSSITQPMIQPMIWMLTTGDLLVAAGLVLLYLEILKSVRTSMASLIDHVLSLLLFTACLVLFILLPLAQTGTFFLILIMTLLDVIAGFTVTIAASRRSVDVGGGL